jgi:hypothetical protein
MLELLEEVEKQLSYLLPAFLKFPFHKGSV